MPLTQPFSQTASTFTVPSHRYQTHIVFLISAPPWAYAPGTDAATDVAGPSLGAEAGPSTTGADGPAAIAEPATEDRTGDSGGADAFDAVLVERPSDADMAAAAREIAAHQAAQPAGPGDAASGEAGAGAGDAVASAGVLPSTGASGWSRNEARAT